MRRRYVLGYDIREDRRLRRVHQLAKAHGYLLQYSMYVCDLDRGELATFKALLSAEIAPEDSILFIDLGEVESGAVRLTFLGSRPSYHEGGALIL